MRNEREQGDKSLYILIVFFLIMIIGGIIILVKTISIHDDMNDITAVINENSDSYEKADNNGGGSDTLVQREMFDINYERNKTDEAYDYGEFLTQKLIDGDTDFFVNSFDTDIAEKHGYYLDDEEKFRAKIISMGKEISGYDVHYSAFTFDSGTVQYIAIYCLDLDLERGDGSYDYNTLKAYFLSVYDYGKGNKVFPLLVGQIDRCWEEFGLYPYADNVYTNIFIPSDEETTEDTSGNE